MTSPLTAELRKQVHAAEVDLRERSERPGFAWAQELRSEYDRAFAAGRTGLTWSEWRDGEITQGAVAWVLGTVFVRFCEDNDLVVDRWIAGVGDGLRRAVDAEAAFYTADPTRGASDWLRDAFGHLADLPGTDKVFDRARSLIWSTHLGDDVCRGLLTYWRQTDSDGQPQRRFDSPVLDTRFLGDLYQDLSELAKKKYALLQTPVFVEEFILDRTLTPALEEFGLPGLRLIDPTCGSGHFLLGAFQRLLAQWQQHSPGLPASEHVRRALDAVHGVDINPFAVAIARFRLVTEALRAAGFRQLADAPRYDLHLAVGDSLLGGTDQGKMVDDEGEVGYFYRDEDILDHPGILDPGRYHVVVGNPPYITVKDKALNEAYRRLYSTCHRQYALSVPFMELFFKLATRGGAQPAGYVGQITSNSFMKREFGTKVIEDLLSGHDPANPVDLLEVIDTSGAYIPGHGTPTVILTGRRRRPVGHTVRAVLGVRGEPGQPDDPARGQVWSEISGHVGESEFDGDFVSIADMPRETLADHPWSLSGGGAGALKQRLYENAGRKLTDLMDEVGFVTITRADQAYFAPMGTWARFGVDRSHLIEMVEGESVRDFAIEHRTDALFPYDRELQPDDDSAVLRLLWPHKQDLIRRREPNGSQLEIGLTWYEWSRFIRTRFEAPTLIAFAEVVTHNHFVLDRGGKVFKQSAPVIKLPVGAGVDEHLGLLGVLNSSVACFWLRQVCGAKGGSGIGRGIQPEAWMERYNFNSTNVADFPLPSTLPVELGRVLDDLAQQVQAVLPSSVCAEGVPSRARLDAARAEYERLRQLMVAWQEELDWHCYRLYGLIDEDLTYPSEPPGVRLGERAFEIALARRVAEGLEETAWFDRHGSTPVCEIPSDWPQGYREVVQRRLDLIASDKSIRLVERPEFKRRWAAESWESMETAALTSYILDRLENPGLWSDPSGPRVLSTAQLAAQVRHDQEVVTAARSLTGEQDPDLGSLVVRLVADEAVPFLAAWRYTAAGMRKRAEWESVWELQRKEDAGQAVEIPVPPKYKPADFRKGAYWKARGKLDVPKERFIAYPGAQPDTDPGMVIGWAGWDHAEQARALARLLVERASQEGWGAQRLTPLLAGLAELQPWLGQWFAERDPAFGASPAEAIRGLLQQRLAGLGLTDEDLAGWRPPEPVKKRAARSR